MISFQPEDQASQFVSREQLAIAARLRVLLFTYHERSCSFQFYSNHNGVLHHLRNILLLYRTYFLPFLLSRRQLTSAGIADKSCSFKPRPQWLTPPAQCFSGRSFERIRIKFFVVLHKNHKCPRLCCVIIFQLCSCLNLFLIPKLI